MYLQKICDSIVLHTSIYQVLLVYLIQLLLVIILLVI